MGATCDAANQSAANCDINQSLLCDNGSCIQVSWVGVGAMCDLTNQCNGLTGGCDGTTCSPPPSSGQACQQSCATGFYCASSGVCVVVSGQGGSCTEAGGCQNGLSCINSSCQPFTYQTCN